MTTKTVLTLIVILALTEVTVQMKNNKKSDIELNVYDQELKACGGGSESSAYQDGKCNEQYGGVHQICFIEIGVRSNKFSIQTGQASDWSSGRGHNNHCVCLGALALYVKRKNMGEFQEDTSIKGL